MHADATSQAAGGAAAVIADDQLNPLHHIGATAAEAQLLHAPGVFVTRRAGRALLAAARAATG
jgi:hypothetical protein